MSSKEKIYSRYMQNRNAAKRISEWSSVLSEIMSPEGKPEALSDTMVLDLSYANFTGMIASSILAEAGAEVIKVEPPEGDPARLMTPYGKTIEGTGIPYIMECRNKYNITLDIYKYDDREKLCALVKKADILIETFEPGMMDGLGIGYRQLKEINPGLIYVAITPYGQYTKDAEKRSSLPWSDLTSQAESGMAALIGALPDDPEPFNWPTRAGFHAATYTSAVSAVCSTLIALFFKRRNGTGQMIDVATADSYSSCVGFPPTIGYIWKKPRPRYGTLDYGLCPYGFFKCKDGYVAIACFRDQDFRAALRILGLWKIEEEWKTLLDRITDDIERAKTLNREIEKVVASMTFDEIFQKFQEFSIKAARSKWRGGGLPVTTKMLHPMEVMEVEHWKVRNAFFKADDKYYGIFQVPVTGKMSKTPLRIKRIAARIGEDTTYIFEKYGIS